MNRLIAFPLLLLNLLLFNPLTQAKDQNCPSGNSKNTAYMRRDNDFRCEGIISPDVARADFYLSSFAIGQLQPTKTLTLIIPKVANLAEPTVSVQSTRKYYQLDPLKLKSQGQQWQFQWTNEVIAEAKISPSSLRSVARAGTENIVIPVRLGQPNSAAYDIRIHTGGRAKNITLKIQQNGKEIYSQTLKDQPNEEVKFSWNGKNSQGKTAPAGRYTLSVNALVESKNSSDQQRNFTQQFEHNSAWLK